MKWIQRLILGGMICFLFNASSVHASVPVGYETTGPAQTMTTDSSESIEKSASTTGIGKISDMHVPKFVTHLLDRLPKTGSMTTSYLFIIGCLLILGLGIYKWRNLRGRAE